MATKAPQPPRTTDGPDTQAYSEETCPLITVTCEIKQGPLGTARPCYDYWAYYAVGLSMVLPGSTAGYSLSKFDPL